MESVIKWQTGEPKKEGEYIITTKGGVGCIYFDPKYVYDLDFFKQFVIAWYPLNNIKPYKEKIK